MEKYNHQAVEPKWQQFWEEERLNKAEIDHAREKLYVLDMFPYPSGAGLHVGHPEGYTATDIYCRAKRMQGYNVLHPMGWDAFGLPAENYAIKTGTHPSMTTAENIATFKRQIQSLGFSYDWDREVDTTDENYFKWTQWIFLQIWDSWFDEKLQKARPISELPIPENLSETEKRQYIDDHRLTYESEMPINWCNSCKTGVANEEVKDGKCDRCGEPIVRKNIRQWVMRITKYADRLISELDGLDWSDSIKDMQRNWIGRSEGAEVDFKVTDSDESFTVYTTRPDTLYGATYCVLAPEHKLLEKLNFTNKHAVAEYQAQAAAKSDLQRTELEKEKTGVRLEGIMAINPINNAEIPIYISDYVLATYGTGAIMAVPAHDTRDHEFARKFGIEIVEVVDSPNKTEGECYAGKGRSINSGDLSGLPTDEMKVEVIKRLEEKSAGKKAVNYKLRDWNFSRQRYWGEPIPIIHCEKCGKVAERNLPLLLPDVEAYEPTGTGESPLAAMTMWVETTCPVCGGAAHRETNTMPQWAGSCWYYLRYTDAKNPDQLASEDAMKYWLGDTGVDLYVGGAEHAVLHLLYSRFWHKVLNDLGHVPNLEPFHALKNQGMILGSDNEKMSKSRGNVINPDEIVEQYGADSLRLYEMFMGPFEAVKPWQMSGVEGVYRFLVKVWRLQEKIETIDMSPKLTKIMHQTIKKVKTDIDNFAFNTAISQMMIFTNEILKQDAYPREAVETLLKLLSSFAPHMTEELWEMFGHGESIFLETYPEYDEALCAENQVEIAVQVLGRLRGTFQADKGIAKEDALAQAKQLENVAKFLDGKEIVKEIYVPDKIVNFVVK